MNTIISFYYNFVCFQVNGLEEKSHRLHKNSYDLLEAASSTSKIARSNLQPKLKEANEYDANYINKRNVHINDSLNEIKK